MFNPIYPVGRKPLVVRTHADYKYTSIAVDQVTAADGHYQVLFLGTGKVLQSNKLSENKWLVIQRRRQS